MHLKKLCLLHLKKLCIMHLKKLCLWQLKNIVHIAPKNMCILHLKNIVHIAPQKYVHNAPQKICCLQLCRLLPLLHLQQNFFFLQAQWRRRGRLHWQGWQHSHGACRQRWARKELGGWVRPHGLRPSRRQRRLLSSGRETGLWRNNKTTLRNKATPHSSQTWLRSRESRPRDEAAATANLAAAWQKERPGRSQTR